MSNGTYTVHPTHESDRSDPDDDQEDDDKEEEAFIPLLSSPMIWDDMIID